MKHFLLRSITLLLFVCIVFSSYALQGCNGTDNDNEPSVTTNGNESTTTAPDVTTADNDNVTPDGTTSSADTTTSKKPDDEAPEDNVKNNEPSDHISSKGDINVKMTEIFKISDHTDANGEHCRVVQGGCTDGTYYYVALNNNDKTENSVNAVLKYELKTGTLVQVFENVKSSHSNDMTYNPETNELFIVHNTPDRQNISVLNPETMEITRTVTLENLEIYSLSYDPYEKCYWAGISYGYNFVKLDLDFKQVGEIITGVETGYTKQGMDLDSKYLYFLQYKSNSVIVYDKQGNFVREITLPKTSYEAENIFHIGDVFYIGYYKTKAGGMLYKTELKEIVSYTASIELEEYKTVNIRTDGQGNVYNYAQGSCSDGKYLYLMMNNSQSTAYRSSLHKIDLATGETVQIVDGIQSGSSNDLTYNEKTGQIIVAIDNPDKNKIVIIDAASMTVTETKTLNQKIYSIAYDKSKDGYFAGLSGSYDFIFLDASFNQVGDKFTGKSTGYTKQGSECANGYVYFLQSKVNAIAIYETSGTLATVIKLPELNVTSAQSICYANGAFYIGFQVDNVGCVIYKATLTIEK